MTGEDSGRAGMKGDAIGRADNTTGEDLGRAREDRRETRVHALRRRLPGLLFLGALILLWQLAGTVTGFGDVLLPPPTRIVAALVRAFAQPSFWTDTVVTLVRFIAGYALGCALGAGIGVLMGLSRTAHDTFELAIELLRPMPATALIPLAILFLGLDNAMVIAIVAWAVTFPVLINTLDGVRGVDPVLVDTGRVFGFRGGDLARHVILPASLPWIVTGMRVALAIGLVLVIVVEMLIGNQGLGHRVIDAERTFRFEEMYGVIGWIGALGYLVNRLFLAVRARALRWYVLSRERG
jgi:ABC-type nitrate/sulfonate/bicarbonate transport system permease component